MGYPLNGSLNKNSSIKPIASTKKQSNIKEIEFYIDMILPIETNLKIKSNSNKKIITKVNKKSRKNLESHKRINKLKIKPNRVKRTPYKIFTLKRTVGVSVAILFFILFIFNVIIPTMQGSMKFLIVLSGSMEPSLNRGDILVIEETNPEEIKLHDVITFTRPDNPNNYITHRVVNITDNEKDGYGFQTQGDANEKPDISIVVPSKVVGKVGFVIPYLGYLPFFAKSFYGFLVFIIIPGLLIISFETRNILKNSKGQIHKKYIKKSIKFNINNDVKKDKKNTLSLHQDSNFEKMHKQIDLILTN